MPATPLKDPQQHKSGKKIVFGIFLLVLLSLHMAGLRAIRNSGNLPLNDFIEYWSSGRVFLNGGNPYNSEELMPIQRSLGWTDSHPLMMWNPPWVLPLLVPFSKQSYWVDRAVWYLFSLLLTFMIADWFWLRFAGSGSRRWISWLAVILFIPVGSALYLGQISPLLLLGLGGFLWAFERDWPGTAGVFLLFLSIKPHVLYLFWPLFLLWVIKYRQWRVFCGLVSAFLIACLLALSVNSSIFGQFYRSITSSSGPAVWQTPTWGVALLMWFPDRSWIRFLPSFLGLLAACLLWRAWRNDFTWTRHLPTIILLSITSSSFTWTFDWIVLLPVVILILAWFSASPSKGWWLLGGLALIFALAILQPYWVHNYFYSLWLPPALWLLYWTAKRGCDSLDSSAALDGR